MDENSKEDIVLTEYINDDDSNDDGESNDYTEPLYEKGIIEEIEKDLNVISYKEFIKIFNNSKKICIVGKGKLRQNIPDGYDYYVGIKQSIAILKRKDILVLNDFEGLFGLENCLHEVKYILFPNMPHIRQFPSIFSKKYVLNYLRECKFTGKIIYYEIKSNKERNKKLFFLDKNINSGDIILSFLEKANSKAKVDIYGMFSSKKDNQQITNIILNAKPKMYLDFFKDYVYRIYTNKKETNRKMVENALRSFKIRDVSTLEVFDCDFKHLQKLTKKNYKKLSINFV